MKHYSILNRTIGTLGLAILLALIASSCGKMDKLTAEQETTVKQTIRDTNTTQKAVPGASNAFRLTDAFSDSRIAPPLQNEKQMHDRLSRAKDAGQCQIDASVPGSGGAPNFTPSTNYHMHVKVSGGSCPVTMNLSMDFQTSSTSAKMDFGFDYRVSESEYLLLNDIDTITLKGDLKADQSSGNGQISGTIHSRTIGDIKAKLTIDGSGTNENNMDMKIAMRLTYPKFEAELRAEAKGRKVTYFINDEEVTEQRFKQFLDDVGNN